MRDTGMTAHQANPSPSDASKTCMLFQVLAVSLLTPLWLEKAVENGSSPWDSRPTRCTLASAQAVVAI